MEKIIVTLLYDLAAFNKLDNIVVSLISEAFNVDAAALCRKKGITYFIKEQSSQQSLKEYKIGFTAIGSAYYETYVRATSKEEAMGLFTADPTDYDWHSEENNHPIEKIENIHVIE